jgi:hypothetical protein
MLQDDIDMFVEVENYAYAHGYSLALKLLKRNIDSGRWQDSEDFAADFIKIDISSLT